jgi:two-component system, LytTR family, sensor histidine kinase AlgZ
MDIVNHDLRVPPNVRSFGARLLRLVGLNMLLALVMALVLARAGVAHNQYGLPGQLADSAIHALIYGLMFGLLMPYLAERLAVLRRPWNWASITLALALLAAAGSLLVQISLLASGLIGRAAFWPQFGYKAATVFALALVIGLCIHTYERIREQMQATILQLRTQELEKERALKLATAARLASLESRLHPHFLFNTLNSISALILEDPPLAEQIVQRLAALLRISLDACNQTHVLLSEEIKLATDYLEIEQARFRERLSFTVAVSPGLWATRVPPLILQPLVENSVKFAVLPRPVGGTIKISARRRAGRLALEVWDDGPGFHLDTLPAGHGLDNLQARLAAQFGDEAQLLINSAAASTAVTVLLPMHDTQAV